MAVVKFLAWALNWNMASSAPPIPAKKLLVQKESILCFIRLMPIASAAISSSRMALNARP